MTRREIYQLLESAKSRLRYEEMDLITADGLAYSQGKARIRAHQEEIRHLHSLLEETKE